MVDVTENVELVYVPTLFSASASVGCRLTATLQPFVTSNPLQWPQSITLTPSYSGPRDPRLADCCRRYCDCSDVDEAP